jgi:hypothetical protein
MSIPFWSFSASACLFSEHGGEQHHHHDWEGQHEDHREGFAAEQPELGAGHG